MSNTTPEKRIEDAPTAVKSHLPTVIGSFVTGVAAMTLAGVLAPTIAAAGSSAQVVVEQQTDASLGGNPVGLTEVTEAQRAHIAARLEAADDALAEARAAARAAIADFERGR